MSPVTPGQKLTVRVSFSLPLYARDRSIAGVCARPIDFLCAMEDVLGPRSPVGGVEAVEDRQQLIGDQLSGDVTAGEGFASSLRSREGIMRKMSTEATRAAQAKKRGTLDIFVAMALILDVTWCTYFVFSS